jgi:hypothetical protein
LQPSSSSNPTPKHKLTTYYPPTIKYTTINKHVTSIKNYFISYKLYENAIIINYHYLNPNLPPSHVEYHSKYINLSTLGPSSLILILSSQKSSNFYPLNNGGK